MDLSDLSVNINEIVEQQPFCSQYAINEHSLSNSKSDNVDSSEEETNVLKDLVNSIQLPSEGALNASMSPNRSV